MKVQEIIKLPEVGKRTAERYLNLIKSGPDIDKSFVTCCTDPKLQFLNAPAWQVAKHCTNCNRIILIFPQDRMGGATCDPYEVYEEPTEDNPHISFHQLNHFMDFCHVADPYDRKKNSFGNIYARVAEYKKYIRMLQTEKKPDLLPAYSKLRHGPDFIEFDRINILENYDGCAEFLKEKVGEL